MAQNTSNKPADNTEAPQELAGPFLVYDEECGEFLNDGDPYNTLKEAEEGIKECIENSGMDVDDTSTFKIYKEVAQISVSLKPELKYV